MRCVIDSIMRGELAALFLLLSARAVGHWPAIVSTIRTSHRPESACDRSVNMKVAIGTRIGAARR